ncbi:MAG: hypothetical protein IPN96_07220 [Anaerolineales bacterium]|nr:hypothetical protein [Anaerolineales bacterium]
MEEVVPGAATLDPRSTIKVKPAAPPASFQSGAVNARTHRNIAELITFKQGKRKMTTDSVMKPSVKSLPCFYNSGKIIGPRRLANGKPRHAPATSTQRRNHPIRKAPGNFN